MEIEPPSTTTIISQDSAHAIMTTALPHFIYVNLVLIVLMMYHMNKHNIANGSTAEIEMNFAYIVINVHNFNRRSRFSRKS